MEVFKYADVIFLPSTAFRNAATFSTSCLSSNDFLPTTWCNIGNLASDLNRREPPANFFASSSGFSETVPVFGFGMSPRGPNIFATFASFGMNDGCATRISNSIFPSVISSISLSSTIATRTVFPDPCGKETCPETLVVSRFKWSSNDSSNLAYEFFFRSVIASKSEYALVESNSAFAFLYFFPRALAEVFLSSFFFLSDFGSDSIFSAGSKSLSESSCGWAIFFASRRTLAFSACFFSASSSPTIFVRILPIIISCNTNHVTCNTHKCFVLHGLCFVFRVILYLLPLTWQFHKSLALPRQFQMHSYPPFFLLRFLQLGIVTTSLLSHAPHFLNQALFLLFSLSFRQRGVIWL